jgi:nicotinamide-nucleotide amidase
MTTERPLPVLQLKDLLLRLPKLTLGVAESLTCGWMQVKIGATPGASNFFLGGLTAYELDQKVKHLGVSRAVAEPVNAVSAEVAEQMARGACRFFGSDLGLATTGYAEPVEERGIQTPFAFWALAHVEANRVLAVRSGRVDCPGLGRLEAQECVASAALGELVSYVRAWRGQG